MNSDILCTCDSCKIVESSDKTVNQYAFYIHILKGRIEVNMPIRLHIGEIGRTILVEISALFMRDENGEGQLVDFAEEGQEGALYVERTWLDGTDILTVPFKDIFFS